MTSDSVYTECCRNLWHPRQRLFVPLTLRRNLCVREAVDLPLTRKVAATEWLTERENP